MKKHIMLAFSIFFLMSCSFNLLDEDLKDGYGRVIFDLTGGLSNARALGKNALPELQSSEVKISIDINDGKKVIEKVFGANEEKIYKGDFPIGTKLNLTVTLKGVSGQWRGELTHIVNRGENPLSIKLKKGAIYLKPLKHSCKLESGDYVFKLSFFDSETPFFKEKVASDKRVAFCRDKIGRIYVFYQATVSIPTYYLRRYTSEGELDNTFEPNKKGALNLTDSPQDFLIFSDSATGNVFASWKYVSSGVTRKNKVALVSDSGFKTSFDVEFNIISYGDVEKMAVYNNVFAVVQKANNVSLRLFKYGNGNLRAFTKLENITNLMHLKVEDNSHTMQDVYGNVVDAYMDESNIWLLYCLSKPLPTESLRPLFGGIIKVKYNVAKEEAKFESKRIIGKDEYKFENGAINVQNEEKEFYGAKGFVGFGENELYVLDEGDRYELKTVIVAKEHKIRIISLNKRGGTISVLQKL